MLPLSHTLNCQLNNTIIPLLGPNNTTFRDILLILKSEVMFNHLIMMSIF